MNQVIDLQTDHQLCLNGLECVLFLIIVLEIPLNWNDLQSQKKKKKRLTIQLVIGMQFVVGPTGLGCNLWWAHQLWQSLIGLVLVTTSSNYLSSITTSVSE